VWRRQRRVARIRTDLEAERSTEGFAKKKEADARRRDKAQAEYVEDFHGAVVEFLAFHGNYADLANRLARAVSDHTTPVGSGTVARTQRIPPEQRAEAAVIAWMRHKTTGYDGMVIPRVRGKRREIRRMLARRSQELLHRYRRAEPVPEGCPLQRALAHGPADEVLAVETVSPGDIIVQNHPGRSLIYRAEVLPCLPSTLVPPSPSSWAEPSPLQGRRRSP
jgi:hypothetical protein